MALFTELDMAVLRGQRDAAQERITELEAENERLREREHAFELDLIESKAENERLRHALSECERHAIGDYQMIPSDRCTSISILVAEILETEGE